MHLERCSYLTGDLELREWHGRINGWTQAQTAFVDLHESIPRIPLRSNARYNNVVSSLRERGRLRIDHVLLGPGRFTCRDSYRVRRLRRGRIDSDSNRGLAPPELDSQSLVSPHSPACDSDCRDGNLPEAQLPADNMGELSASSGTSNRRRQRFHGSIVNLHSNWSSAAMDYQRLVFFVCCRNRGDVLLCAAEMGKEEETGVRLEVIRPTELKTQNLGFRDQNQNMST